MKSIFGLLLVVGVAVWSGWPMVIRPDRVADYGKDGMLLATIQMNWHRKFSDYIRRNTDPKIKMFDGYYFYAEKNTLVYTDMIFITSLMTYWPTKLINNLAAGAGWGLVGWQVISMMVSYAIFAKMAKSVWGGVIGSVVFGLSQIHFVYQVHLQNWNICLWLLSFWLFKERRYLLSGLFLGMQMWESPLGVYFALVAIFIHLAIFPFKHSFKNLFILLVVFGGVFLLVAYLPSRAYWEVSQYYHFTRTIRDAAYHGLSLNGLREFVSPGLFSLLVLGIILLIKSQITNHKSQTNFKLQNRNIKFLIFLIIAAYVLALGPVLKWGDKTVKIGGKVPIPLPYAVAYYLVPGWQAFRVPSRWLVVGGWAAAGIIAIGFSHLDIYHLPLKKTIGLLGVFAIAVLGGTRLVKYVDLPREIPKEYLVDQEVLTFKPMGGEPKEIERMYFSIMAGKKTMNGFSGFIPPERVKYLMN